MGLRHLSHMPKPETPALAAACPKPPTAAPSCPAAWVGGLLLSPRRGTAYDHLLVEPVVQDQAVGQRQAMRLHGVPRSWKGNDTGSHRGGGYGGKHQPPASPRAGPSAGP